MKAQISCTVTKQLAQLISTCVFASKEVDPYVLSVWVLLSHKALYKGVVAASCKGRVHPFDHVRTRVRIEIFQKSNYLNIKQTTPTKAHSVVSYMYLPSTSMRTSNISH